MGLADELINRTKSGAPLQTEPVTIEEVPALILRKHPSIYKHRGILYHEHKRIRPANQEDIFLLADSHSLKLTKAQCAWVYNRLLERAPDLEEDFIMVSWDYVWNKKVGQLMPTKDFGEIIITPNERTTNGRMGQGGEHEANGESVSGSAPLSG